MSLMDRLRIVKSKIEGSYYEFPQMRFEPALLSDLKHAVLSHTAASLPELEKVRLAHLVSKLLEAHVKKIVFCCLVTCPFYSGAQSCPTDQAKQNSLFVVFVAQHKHFFSLATQHEKRHVDVIDEVSNLPSGPLANSQCLAALCRAFFMHVKFGTFVSNC